MLTFPAVMWEDSALIELFHADYLEIMTEFSCADWEQTLKVSQATYIIVCIHLRVNMQKERNSGLCWVYVAPCSCIWTPAHSQPVTSFIRQKCLMAFHPLTISWSSVLQQCCAMQLTSAVTLSAFFLSRYRAVLLILPMAQDCCSPRWPRKPPKGGVELKRIYLFALVVSSLLGTCW